MNNWVLKTVSVADFWKDVTAHANQLLTSKTVEDVCDSICKNLLFMAEPGQNVFNIAGKTGSGRTTFCQAIVELLMQNRVVKVGEFIYIKIDKSDNVNCVWNYGVELARGRNMGSSAALLTSGSSTHKTKLNSMVEIFDSFKVVCFDGVTISEIDHQLYSLLMCIISQLKSNVIYVSKSDTLTQTENYGTVVEVHGLDPTVIFKDLNWQKTIEYLCAIYKSIDQTILLNPEAVRLLGNASQIIGTLWYKVEEVNTEKSPVLFVLDLIWKELSDHDREILCQLSELRRPLPLKEASLLLRVIQMGLVEFVAPGLHGNLFGQVMLSDCVRDFVLTKRNNRKMLTEDSKFNVLDYWMILLSSELVDLVEEARKNSWPFVPEKWQYVTNAGEKESYNIKDLITMKAKNLPHLTNFDILQEILHHSVLRKDHKNMAVILFLIDRYIYWQGGSKILLDIVDSIMEEKPELPIAPQLVIRKARLLRTSGDLQGAEKVLDKLLNEKEQLGMWRYSEEHHHHLVKAVCVQIKGEIQATLGQWYNSAVLLLDSVHLFKTLPKVDKKGLSCSLGLLVNTLQRMSVEEFQLLAQRYFLKASHPYLQAYEFAIEAAELAIFTPLFYARHKRRAGEMMLEYSKLYTDELKPRYLSDALKELKESLAAHKNLDSLKSREQYYEFICALYKISCAFNSKDEKEGKLQELKFFSMILFKHYGSHQSVVVHDVNSQYFINRATKLLKLPSFIENDLKTAGRSETLAFTAPVKHAQAVKSPMVDRLAETVQTLTVGETVDRSKTTESTADEYVEDRSGMISGHLEEKNDERETRCVSDLAAKLLTKGPYSNIKSPMVDRFAETVQTMTVDATVDRSRTTLSTLNDYVEDRSVDRYVNECEVSSYDAVNSEWKEQRTLVYIGEQLNLTKDNEGAQRDPFMVEYLGQDEPMGKYVGKRYKRPREVKQYKADVECQMTARYYVGLFNQELYHQRIEVSPIQFLPVVMLTILDDNGNKTKKIYNVEPYLYGNFTKLTNNWSWVEKEGPGSKLVLAFSHFTYERSRRTLLITDHQGWASDDHLSTTFLTDPQIHSIDKTLYGTGNLGTPGMDNFWNAMHEECNEICQQLGLTRPQ